MNSTNKLNSKLNSDYLSVLNKRLLAENDQLKKVKDQSNLIIANLNSDLSSSYEKIEKLQQKYEKSSISTDKEIDNRIKPTNPNYENEIKQLKFELNQALEGLSFKERTLKNANSELVSLRASVLDLKAQINHQEERSLGNKTQIEAKDDKIKLLEKKISNLLNSTSIAIKLEIQQDQSFSKVLNELTKNNQNSRNNCKFNYKQEYSLPYNFKQQN